MRLTLIRHTKVAVPSGICYGQTDVALAASYQEEKESILKELERLHFDQVFCSPLNRCKQLANDLFSSQSILFDDRLKELDFGEWEEKEWDDIYQSDVGKYWMNNYLEVSCMGGESYPDFRNRVVSFLNELKCLSCHDVLVVTHAGVIRLVKSILENQRMDEVFAIFNPVYGGIYTFELR